MSYSVVKNLLYMYVDFHTDLGSITPAFVNYDYLVNKQLVYSLNNNVYGSYVKIIAKMSVWYPCPDNI